MDIAKKRVEAGVRWLDEHKPGWDKLIKLNVFDMKSATSCILGQLSGDVEDFLEENNLDHSWATEYGFDCVWSGNWHISYESVSVEEYFDVLHDLWIGVLTERA